MSASPKLSSLRDAFGEELARLGDERSDIVVLDADTSTSTRSAIFGKQHPERFINVGLQEQNMMGMAAGLASSGKKVFVAGFATFVTGMVYNMIRQSICYPGLDVTIVASHAGITVGEDGATHQMTEDLGLMAGLPNMKVISPADAPETKKVIDYIAGAKGPFYVRLAREKFPEMTDGFDFKLGRGLVLEDGSDATVVSTGITLHEAAEAVKLLKGNGISARLIHMPSLKPIDADLLAKAARETGLIVTVEDHSIYNGLGSRVAEVVAEGQPAYVRRVGIRDVFGESGKAEELMVKYGIDRTSVAKAVLESMNLKRR
ncbi:MAG: transketolase family protein [TACK group archaeon]|nr:transketolase family protein [TACK group archaeon]